MESHSHSAIYCPPEVPLIFTVSKLIVNHAKMPGGNTPIHLEPPSSLLAAIPQPHHDPHHSGLNSVCSCDHGYIGVWGGGQVHSWGFSFWTLFSALVCAEHTDTHKPQWPRWCLALMVFMRAPRWPRPMELQSASGPAGSSGLKDDSRNYLCSAFHVGFTL